MNTTIWLRAETKHHEQRTALTPATAKMLIDAGLQVVVERSEQAAIPADAFAECGCQLAPAGTWRQAPSDVYILGLKELPDDGTALHHRHIYFAHAYKDQRDWQSILRRFTCGGGQLLDIEFLCDAEGRRVAAFGYWAGYAGAGAALKAWCAQAKRQAMPPLGTYNHREVLLDELRAELDAIGQPLPSVMIIGALGRVGSGACDLVEALGLSLTRWDMDDTASGGPFDSILAHAIFINCVMVKEALPPFVTREQLNTAARKLRVISDISCDPLGAYNPLPIYTRCTTFSQPAARIVEGDPPLDLVAIDHLPSMLPVESSEDFSRQLAPYLLRLDPTNNPVWRGSLDWFKTKINQL